MPGLSNNLYPPIFKKSYVPAFVGTCKVYFSISIYNSLNQINQSCVQVIVQNQKTNQSILKKSLYPSGIKITNLIIDNDKKTDDRYYIEISDKDIQGNKFNYNQYYKVQIRFTDNTLSKIPNSSVKIDGWLNSNLDHFSEWSTVLLIKPISAPVISLRNFDSKVSSTTITTSDLTILGTVNQSQSSDHESLKSYRIFIYNNQDSLIEDSGNQYFYNSNEIQYNCKYNFQSGYYYKMTVQILTKNLYQTEESYNFYVSYSSFIDLDATIIAQIDTDAACAVITISNNSLVELGTNIVIRRTSNKENFTIWEDLFTTVIQTSSSLNLVWKDYTIQSGVWYKYSVVRRNKNNFRSLPIEINEPIMGEFEDIFLTTKNQQLKIKFDPQVNNYSRVVSQSLSETIGSKYPFIRRNGKVDYKTFSISGTISYFGDISQNLMHSSKEELYGEYSLLYENYNKNNNITLFNDYIQQREFREKVLDFLYADNVKLYKSATEGNILIKLMNITLTPNNNLSRLIWTFNCSAYEIDDFNYLNCVKYGIQEEGEYIEQDERYITKYGQIIIPTQDIYYKETYNSENIRKYSTVQRYYFGTKDLLTGMLREKYKNLETENTSISVGYLSYLKIELTSNPYLIGIKNGIPSLLTEDDNNIDVLCLGHIVKINGQTIIINKDGIYELSGEGTQITSLSFVSPDEQGIIDFEVNLIENLTTKTDDISELTSIFKVGQLWGTFNLTTNLIRTIYTDIVNKYYFISEDGSFNQSVRKISGLRIQADPGVSFYVKENQDSQYEKHTLNQTGLLEFYDQDTDIRGLYFVGPKLIEVSAQQKQINGIHQYEFYDTEEVISLYNFKNPKNNYVYKVSPFEKMEDGTLIIDKDKLDFIDITKLFYLWSPLNTEAEEIDTLTLGLLYESFDRYIYYQGQWYPFSEENEVLIPNIEAVIDYYCEILRKRY